MTIQSRLEELYDSWRDTHPSPQFIKCGVVDEPTHQASPRRVVWVLKEAVCDTREDWSMACYLREVVAGRPPSRTASALGVLTWGVLHPDAPYESALEHWKDGIRSLAMTNLKKSGGASASRWRVIDHAAEESRDLWVEELRIMAPHVIFCGGTFWNVVPRLACTEVDEIPNAATCRVWQQQGMASVVVHAHHPSYWGVKREVQLTRLRATVAGAAHLARAA